MSVFNQHYADQYDEFYAKKDYFEECNLIETAIRRFAKNTPATVLDIGCGTGGHAIELSRRGYHVTGVDLSQPMLDRAHSKSTGLSKAARPTWIHGDARNFITHSSFDLGIMMFAVIGYLNSNEDVLAGLRNIRRQLKPGALFICDFWYGPSVLAVKPTDRMRIFTHPDGKTIRSASTVLNVPQHTAIVTINLWCIKKGVLKEESSEEHYLRYFFPQEFDLFLAMAGFRLESLTAFPSLDKPLSDDTWNAIGISTAI